MLRDGVAVPLTPKAFDLLVVFVENPGRLLDKNTLMQRVWPDSFGPAEMLVAQPWTDDLDTETTRKYVDAALDGVAQKA